MSANPHGQRMPRAERAAQIRRLKDAGLTFNEIAEYLQLSKSTVTGVYYDPTGEQAQARKAKHEGTCSDCGGKTSYGTDGPSKRCNACFRLHEKTVEARLSRKGGKRIWSDEAILEAIRSAVREDGIVTVTSYNEKRAADPASMPSLPLITWRFGKWVNAVERAGLRTSFRPKDYDGSLTPAGALLAAEECAAELGAPPTYREYEAWAARVGAPCGTRLRQVLGTWQEVTRMLVGADVARAA